MKSQKSIEDRIQELKQIQLNGIIRYPGITWESSVNIYWQTVAQIKILEWVLKDDLQIINPQIFRTGEKENESQV